MSEIGTSSAPATPHDVVTRVRSFVAEQSDRALASREAASAFAIRVMSAGIAFLSQVILARWMGAHEYGVFAYCWVWLTVLGILAPFGLNTSLLRFLPAYAENNNWQKFRGLVQASRAIAIGVATAIALIGGLVVHATAGMADDIYTIPLCLMLICLPMFALADINEGISRSRSWIWLALLPDYIVRPLLLLASIAVALLLGAPANAETAMTAVIFATWITAIGQQLLVERRLVRTVPKGRGSRDLRLWIGVSLPLFMVEGFFLVLANTDVIVLNFYMGPVEAAIYYAALKTTMLLSLIYYAVATAFTHRFSAYKAAGDTEGLANILKDAVTWTFWPTLAGSIVILLFGWPLLWLFGSAFTAAYPAMFVLVVGILARAAVGPVEQMLSMLGGEWACAGVLAAAAIFNLAMNIVLIPHYGLLGAAIATSAANILVALLLFRLAKKRLGCGLRLIG